MSFGKSFWKQIKTIVERQLEALKNLIPKEQTKAIEGRSDNENNQSIAAKIFNDLIKKRKSITNELYENVDMNKVYLSRQVLLKM